MASGLLFVLCGCDSDLDLQLASADLLEESANGIGNPSGGSSDVPHPIDASVLTAPHAATGGEPQRPIDGDDAESSGSDDDDDDRDDDEAPDASVAEPDDSEANNGDPTPPATSAAPLPEPTVVPPTEPSTELEPLPPEPAAVPPEPAPPPEPVPPEPVPPEPLAPPEPVPPEPLAPPEPIPPEPLVPPEPVPPEPAPAPEPIPEPLPPEPLPPEPLPPEPLPPEPLPPEPVPPEPIPQPEPVPPEPEPNVTCTIGALTGVTDGLGGCLVLIAAPLAWDAARNACLSLGTGWDLASVPNVAVNDLITGMVLGASLPRAWIGGTDVTTEGQWLWIVDASGFWVGGTAAAGGVPAASAYANWASDQPNAGTGSNCTSLLGTLAPGGGLWADDGCAGQRPYVCRGPTTP